MTHDLREIWEKLHAEASSPVNPEHLQRLDVVIAVIGELQKTFERERGERQPFTSNAPCPICDIGTVAYCYRAPLVGHMRCDTPQCVALNF